MVAKIVLIVMIAQRLIEAVSEWWNKSKPEVFNFITVMKSLYDIVKNFILVEFYKK